MTLGLGYKKVIGLLLVATLLVVSWRVYALRTQEGPQAQVKGKMVGPPKKLWEFQCIDTMKYSRDTAREFLTYPDRLAKTITLELGYIASLGATCVALGTPYDEEFYPVLSAWVSGARQRGLHVWFRGNFSAWEGWFDYPKFKNAAEHHTLTTAFITKHPELFAGGDIFTPAPEAENGMLGNPWRSEQAKQDLRNFAIASASNCIKAFTAIGKQDVRCGYQSANGDVAQGIFTKEVFEATGGVAVIDHYVSTTERMERDINDLAARNQVPVVLGEFGNPIPDIHGNQTELEQAEFARAMLHQFYKQRDKVRGLNYWVLRGGSTALVNSDGTPRLATLAVQDYFRPFQVTGEVKNSLGKAVKDAVIEIPDGPARYPDEAGDFAVSFPAGTAVFTVSAPGYHSQTVTLTGKWDETIVANVALEPTNSDLWYKFQEFLKGK